MVPPGLGILIWGSGGPWDYYLGVWGPKIILNFVSVYRVATVPFVLGHGSAGPYPIIR